MHRRMEPYARRREDKPFKDHERIIINSTENFQSRINGLLLLLTLGLCIAGAGCRNVATTWSATVPSPDGRWLAMARSQQWGGPGAAYDATTVFLKPTRGTQPPTQVLVFSHQYATMNLKMDWVAPTQLKVSYAPSTRPDDHVSVDFEAVKCGGVDIAVQEIPRGNGDSPSVQ